MKVFRREVTREVEDVVEFKAGLTTSKIEDWFKMHQKLNKQIAQEPSGIPSLKNQFSQPFWKIKKIAREDAFDTVILNYAASKLCLVFIYLNRTSTIKKNKQYETKNVTFLVERNTLL